MHGLLALVLSGLAFVAYANKNEDQLPANFTFQITSRFNRLSLDEFLKTKPDLWTSKPVTKKQISYYKSTMGSLSDPSDLEIIARYSRNRSDRKFKQELPTHFDARQRWASCRSIKTILDQSRCANCWAFAAATSFSDRICIATKGRHQPQISSTDLVNCCQHCYSDGHNGCTGGYPFKAWKHLITHGAVTGSSYRNHSGCIPYEFPSCNPDLETNSIDPGCQFQGYQTGQCRTQCQPGYYRPYNKDKYYATKIVHPRTVREMQLELYKNGPIEVRMQAYEDLVSYTGGIYYHRYGSSVGMHSVKLVGEEGGVPYWIVSNSWNDLWGEQGFFKIVRGRNEVGIESQAVAGIVDLRRIPH